jgi:hypothetical protein
LISRPLWLDTSWLRHESFAASLLIAIGTVCQVVSRNGRRGSILRNSQPVSRLLIIVYLPV